MMAVLVGDADWQFDKDDGDKKVLHVASFGVKEITRLCG